MGSNDHSAKPVERIVERSQIVEMLRKASERQGLDFDRFYDLGRSGLLDAPELRDLWLIWGDILTEGDIRQTV